MDGEAVRNLLLKVVKEARPEQTNWDSATLPECPSTVFHYTNRRVIIDHDITGEFWSYRDMLFNVGHPTVMLELVKLFGSDLTVSIFDKDVPAANLTCYGVVTPPTTSQPTFLPYVRGAIFGHPLLKEAEVLSLPVVAYNSASNIIRTPAGAYFKLRQPSREWLAAFPGADLALSSKLSTILPSIYNNIGFSIPVFAGKAA